MMRPEEQSSLFYVLEQVAHDLQHERPAVLEELAAAKLEPAELEGAIGYFDDRRARAVALLELEQLERARFWAAAWGAAFSLRCAGVPDFSRGARGYACHRHEKAATARLDELVRADAVKKNGST
jgi:hypothetical protein